MSDFVALAILVALILVAHALIALCDRLLRADAQAGRTSR